MSLWLRGPWTARPVRARPLVIAAAQRAYRAVTAAEVQKQDEEYESQIREVEDIVAAAGFPKLSLFRQPVIWGDHDQFQHVNNVHYIRWFESARMRWIERITGTMRPELRDNLAKGQGVGVILAATWCRYRRPVTYPDTVVIGTAPYPVRRTDRALIKGVAYSVAQRALVAEAEFDCVAYDYDKLCKSRFPEDLVDAMKVWEYTGKDSDKK